MYIHLYYNVAQYYNSVSYIFGNGKSISSIFSNVRINLNNRELKSLLTSSARLQPPTPRDIELEGSIHAPTPHTTIMKSANPVPIIPPQKDRTPTRNTIPPFTTTPMQRHHKSWLVIHFTPHIESKAFRPHGCIVHEINEALKKISPHTRKCLRQRNDHLGGKRHTNHHSGRRLHRRRLRSTLSAHHKNSS